MKIKHATKKPLSGGRLKGKFVPKVPKVVKSSASAASKTAALQHDINNFKGAMIHLSDLGLVECVRLEKLVNTADITPDDLRDLRDILKGIKTAAGVTLE